jgi:hypothetical protein
MVEEATSNDIPLSDERPEVSDWLKLSREVGCPKEKKV